MSTPEWAADVADIVPPEAWQRFGGEWRAPTEEGLWQVYSAGMATLSRGTRLTSIVRGDEEVAPVLRALLAGLRAMEAEYKRQTVGVDLDTVEAWEMVRLEVRGKDDDCWSVSALSGNPRKSPMSTLYGRLSTLGVYRIVHRETGAVLAGEGA